MLESSCESSGICCL